MAVGKRQISSNGTPDPGPGAAFQDSQTMPDLRWKFNHPLPGDSYHPRRKAPWGSGRVENHRAGLRAGSRCPRQPGHWDIL